MRMENRNIIALFLLAVVIIFGFLFYKLENSGISINFFENRIKAELEKKISQVEVNLSNSNVNYLLVLYRGFLWVGGSQGDMYKKIYMLADHPADKSYPLF